MQFEWRSLILCTGANVPISGAEICTLHEVYFVRKKASEDASGTMAKNMYIAQKVTL